MLSLRPLVEIEAVLAEHVAAPERRLAQRALADEMTAMVHGEAALSTARAAADLLFGGDPIGVGSDVLEVLSAELPTVDIGELAEGSRVHDVLMPAGLAGSTSEVNRLLAQRGVRISGRVADADGVMRESDLLAGRFILVRKGKRDHVLVRALARMPEKRDAAG
jgi:tyrosyl-tRNA synthetase